MAHQLLDGSNVVVALQEPGTERVAEAVAAGGLGDARGPHGAADSSLDDGLMKMMSLTSPGLGVDVETGRGEDPLPAQDQAAVGYFRSSA